MYIHRMEITEIKDNIKIGSAGYTCKKLRKMSTQFLAIQHAKKHFGLHAHSQDYLLTIIVSDTSTGAKYTLTVMHTIGDRVRQQMKRLIKQLKTWGKWECPNNGSMASSQPMREIEASLKGKLPS